MDRRRPDGLYSCGASGLGCFSALAQDAQIDPQPDAALHMMPDYSTGQRACSLSADASTEMLLQDGRKVQLTGTSQMTVDRERVLHIEPQGSCAER